MAQGESGHIRRFPAHDFQYVGLTLQTSRANNKLVIITFKFGCPRLTLKEWLKVKSDHITRFPAYDFPYIGLTLQASRTNNKRVIINFKFGCPRLTLKVGPKVKSDHTKDSQPMISYKLVSHCKLLGPIIRKL